MPPLDSASSLVVQEQRRGNPDSSYAIARYKAHGGASIVNVPMHTYCALGPIEKHHRISREGTMKRMRTALSALLVLAVAPASVAMAQAGKPPVQPQGQQRPGQAAQRPQAPQTQQQQQQHQRMMTQMQETMQRVTQLQQRAHQLSQTAQQRVQGRAQVTEQERLMQRTCEALDQHAQQLRMLGDRAQDMIRSRDFQRDQEMQRDMDRLRQHLNTMANELDGSLKLMERLQQRVHAPATP
jgi:hypothetical protein